MSPDDDPELAERLGRVEALVRAVDGFADPAARERTREIVEAVLDLHAAAFERILALLGGAEPLVDALATDELVSSVLLLHELHPHGLEARVRAALDRVRTGLVLGGARAELAAIEPSGAIRVRVVRESQGCGSDAGRLHRLVAEALERAAPEATAIEVAVETEPSGAFVPLERFRSRPPPPGEKAA